MPINNMTEEIAGSLIMTARAPLFEGKNKKWQISQLNNFQKQLDCL
jgi:hypothetical protein